MCKCAEEFKCDSDQSRIETKHQVALDTIAKLDFKLNEANELLTMYRNISIEHEQEVERLHARIKELSNWHNPFHA